MIFLFFLVFGPALFYAGFYFGKNKSEIFREKSETDDIAWSYAMDVSLDCRDPYEALNKMYAQMPFDSPERRAIIKAMKLVPAAKEEIRLLKHEADLNKR